MWQLQTETITNDENILLQDNKLGMHMHVSPRSACDHKKSATNNTNLGMARENTKNITYNLIIYMLPRVNN